MPGLGHKTGQKPKPEICRGSVVASPLASPSRWGIALRVHDHAETGFAQGLPSLTKVVFFHMKHL